MLVSSLKGSRYPDPILGNFLYVPWQGHTDHLDFPVTEHRPSFKVNINPIFHSKPTHHPHTLRLMVRLGLVARLAVMISG
ncbi:hypothetical protein N656DRAFT_775808 [Canariomyces notabilis]|uniref:Uncharacterized protein n=1 Tax=Canariomyces notabilis TaxID=2074819 RepID=A0AAN6TJV2_9PEZI|nr:hypothetical protein N656DRAFT_775808 [Canariomyces arenarius]